MAGPRRRLCVKSYPEFISRTTRSSNYSPINGEAYTSDCSPPFIIVIYLFHSPSCSLIAPPFIRRSLYAHNRARHLSTAHYIQLHAFRYQELAMLRHLLPGWYPLRIYLKSFNRTRATCTRHCTTPERKARIITCSWLESPNEQNNLFRHRPRSNSFPTTCQSISSKETAEGLRLGGL